MVFWLGDERFAPGAIVLLREGGEPRLLAPSLASWLGRVAACDGIDVLLEPERAGELTPVQRALCVERGLLPE